MISEPVADTGRYPRAMPQLYSTGWRVGAIVGIGDSERKIKGVQSDQVVAMHRDAHCMQGARKSDVECNVQTTRSRSGV